MEVFSINNFEAIKRSYLDSYIIIPKDRNEGTGSILPRHASFIHLFGQNIKDEPVADKAEEMVTVNANFFGPFRPEEFFASEVRALVMLKEDYIEKSGFEKGDRGGHQKAVEYGDEEAIKESKTYSIIMDTLIRILDGMGVRKVGEKDEDLFLNHTAILNINPFPALAFDTKKSHKDVVRAWSSVDANRKMLHDLIELLSPTIMIAGGTLKHFLTNEDLYVQVRDRKDGCDMDLGRVFERRILSAKVYEGKHGAAVYVDENGAIWADEDHPNCWNGQVQAIVSAVIACHDIIG